MMIHHFECRNQAHLIERMRELHEAWRSGAHEGATVDREPMPWLAYGSEAALDYSGAIAHLHNDSTIYFV